MSRLTYRHTIAASYLGYITQAIVNNLAPRGQIQQGRGASGGRVVNLNAPQALLLPNAEQMAQQRAGFLQLHRVRQNGHEAAFPHQRQRLRHAQALPRHIRRCAIRQKAVKRLARVHHIAVADHRAGDMRPTDAALASRAISS